MGAVHRFQAAALVARATMWCGGGTSCRKIGEPLRHRASCLTTAATAFGLPFLQTKLDADVAGHTVKWKPRVWSWLQRRQQPEGYHGNPPSADLAAVQAAGVHAAHHHAVVFSGVQIRH